MTAVAEISYPAFAFVFRGRSVVIIHDRNGLSEATPSQLRAGFFATPFVVVDSQLSRWEIREVRPLAPDFLTKLVDSVTNRSVRLELIGSPEGAASLADLKVSIEKALLDDPTGIWMGREETPDELIRSLEPASTFQEVLATLDWPARR